MQIKNIINSIKKKFIYLNREIGQNFLINIEILKKIASLLKINAKDNVLEIGSGFGNLSFFLIQNNFKSLTLNDIDDKNIVFLKKLVSNVANNKNINIIQKSILKLDIFRYDKIISNLPYYITHRLLEYCMIYGNATKYVFMVQKEVIAKINAKINTLHYGPLSILINYVGKIKKEFGVSGKNFLPIAHVNSVVFSIIKNKKQKLVDKHQYFLFLKKMFLYRRKTIFNNLTLYLKDRLKAQNILNRLNIFKTNRPEQISQNIYLKIFKILKNK